MDAKSGPSIPLECVSLAEALFCAECEMISNSRTYCLCCGSSAVVPVARLLGGSLRQHQRTVLLDYPAPGDKPSRPQAASALRGRNEAAA